MARKRKTKGRKKQPAAGSRLWLWLALFGVSGAILVGLVWVALQPSAPPVPPPSPTPTAVAPVAEEELAAATEAFLATVPVRNSLVRRNLEAAPIRYTVDGEPPPAGQVAAFRARLAELSPNLSVRLTDDGLLVIAEDGVRKVLVFFVPGLRPLPTGPRVAIIVDDLGRDLQAAETLVALAQPVTFSILPGEAHTRQTARMARAAGREVLIHAPMEPQGFPDVNPGSEALFLESSDEEIARRFARLLETIPEAVGTNNHMGSRFTEDRRGMGVVMTILRQRGLFFVDSLTTSRSVGRETADAHGVAVLQRDVFLDNVADVEKIAVQLRKLADRAVRTGQAVGICHPYPETLQALKRELPRLADEGIRFVPVSALLPGGGRE